MLNSLNDQQLSYLYSLYNKQLMIYLMFAAVSL